MAILLAATTVLSTLLGGLVALHVGDRRHLLLGFTAGVLLGLVAFDLIPEVFRTAGVSGSGVPPVMLAFAGGFLLLHVIEQAAALHHAHESEYGDHHHPLVGVVSALALAAHSFLDGVGIGLGFQAGTSVGITVAVAVIAHDFADGMNTVTIALVNRNSRRRSVALLALDAVAPVLGATATVFFAPSERVLSLYLGFFAGFLLYLATADILPEAHAGHPSRLTLASTVLGMGAILGVVAICEWPAPEAITAALERASGFVSAQQLHAQLRIGGQQVGLATVYRHLAALAREGSVDVLRSDDGETVYRRCTTVRHHHHLVCRRCGRTVEVGDSGVERWADSIAAEHGFYDVRHTVDLFGTCSSCAR